MCRARSRSGGAVSASHHADAWLSTVKYLVSLGADVKARVRWEVTGPDGLLRRIPGATGEKASFLLEEDRPMAFRAVLDPPDAWPRECGALRPYD